MPRGAKHGAWLGAPQCVPGRSLDPGVHRTQCLSQALAEEPRESIQLVQPRPVLRQLRALSELLCQ